MALSSDESNPSACRALIVARLLRGEESAAHDALQAYLGIKEATAVDLYLMDLVEEWSETDNKTYHQLAYDFHETRSREKSLSRPLRDAHRARAGFHAMQAGLPLEWSRHTAKLHRCRQWSVLGPFDNTSGSGRHREHLARWVRDGEVRAGKFGQQIEWFTAVGIGPDCVLTPSHYFFYDSATTSYACTYVRVPKQGPYLVTVSHAGDLAFRIDGRDIYEGTRSPMAAPALWRIELAAGMHVFSFKVSHRADGGALTLAVTDPAEKLDDDISYSKSDLGLALAEAPAVIVEQHDFEVDAGLAGGPALSGPELEFWTLLARRLWIPPSGLVEEKTRTTGMDGLEHLFAGMAEQSLGNDTAAGSEYQAALEAQPDLVPALVAGARLELDRDLPDRAEDKARAVLKLTNASLLTHDVLMKALLAQQKHDELERLIALTESRWPHSPLSPSHAAELAAARGLRQDELKARATAESRLSYISEHVSNVLRRSDDPNDREIIHHLEALVALVPDNVHLSRALMSSLIAHDELHRAYEHLIEARRIFPQDVALIEQLAMIEETGRDKPEAAAALLREALAITPGDMSFHARLRDLEHRAPLITYLPAPDLQAILSRRNTASRETRILRHERRRFAFDSHGSILDEFMVVEVGDKSGIGAWENIALPHAGFLQDVTIVDSRTIKADGSSREAERTPLNVVYPGLEPGDVILLHLRYSLHVAGRLAGHFWDQHEFGDDEPCLHSSYTLITPADLGVTTKVWNATHAGPVRFQQADLNEGYTQRTWTAENLPATPGDPYRPDTAVFRPWIDVSTLSTWQDVALWYDELSAEQRTVTPRVRQKAAALTEGVANPQEAVQRILSFVANEINYESIPFLQGAVIPRSADEVLRDGYGDCKDKAVLMVALLEAAGRTDARVALTETGSHADRPYLPSTRFDHAVVALGDPRQGRTWCDPTADFAEPTWIPGSIEGAVALVIDPATDELDTIRLQEGPGRDLTSRTELELEEDGDATLKRADVFTSGPLAAAIRAAHAEGDSATLVRSLLGDLAADHPGVEIMNLVTAGLDRATGPVSLSYDIRIPGLFRTAGPVLTGVIPLRTLVKDGIGRIVASAKRDLPLDLRSLASREQEEFVVNYPAGFSILSAQEGAGGQTSAVAWDLKETREAGRLVLDRNLDLTGTIVAPDRYGELKASLEALLRGLAPTLVFQRGP